MKNLIIVLLLVCASFLSAAQGLNVAIFKNTNANGLGFAVGYSHLYFGYEFSYHDDERLMNHELMCMVSVPCIQKTDYRLEVAAGMGYNILRSQIEIEYCDNPPFAIYLGNTLMFEHIGLFYLYEFTKNDFELGIIFRINKGKKK